MPDYSTEIATLESLLNSGALSVTVDGVTTTFRSAAEIQSRIAQLKSETDGGTNFKRTSNTIRFTRF